MSLSLSQPSEITVDPQSHIPDQENARSAIYSLTPGLTEGPFYKAGAPFKDQFADNPTMNVTGRVYNVYGDILSGAVLDFWQADEGGVYDVDGYKLRGKVRANEDGRYILKTIRPGNYAVTTKITRSAHIHVKVSIEGYKTLTTQLYFVGDKYSRDDPWFHKNTVLPGAESSGEFNFVIEEEQENTPTAPQEKAANPPKEPLQEKPLTKPHSPTPILSEGTFYKEGAPFRKELSEKPTLHISGQVLDVYGNVIEGAIMEFWQADEKGAFDTEGFNLRGQIKSEQEGHYEVKTIRPGNYTDSTNKIRSSQIYVRITAPSYRTLTTQLYFRDDKYNDEDLEFTPSTLIPEDNKFNFILEKLEDIWTSFTQRPTKNQSSSSDGTSLYTPTPSCVEGLFYKEGAPFRNKLSENPNLHFSGRVFNIHGEVVEGAILDFWQNNESGIFDTEGFRLRGKVKVDNKGQYELNTIRPIHYPVTIKITRTAHIHVKVSAPGYKTLTTQLYFAGEKYNETDPWFNPGTVISSENEFNFVIEKSDN